LAAIVAAVIPRLLRETQPKSVSAISSVMNLIRGVVTWIFLVGIVGLPYWIVLIPLHDLLLGNELPRELAHSPALWFTFGALAAGHFWKAFQSGYDAMPDKELKQRVRWDVYLLVLRAMAMFIMAAHGLAFILVPLMALLLSYFEIWPERVLGAVFGDPSRLYEYDPDNPASSRRRH
jgi:DNA-binding transcriptional LysR family regulator